MSSDRCPQCDAPILADLERGIVSHESTAPCETFRLFSEKKKDVPCTIHYSDRPQPARGALYLEKTDREARALEFRELMLELLDFVIRIRNANLREWANSQTRMAEVLLATTEVANTAGRDAERETFFRRAAEGVYNQMRAHELPPAPARFRP